MTLKYGANKLPLLLMNLKPMTELESLGIATIVRERIRLGKKTIFLTGASLRDQAMRKFIFPPRADGQTNPLEAFFRPDVARLMDGTTQEFVPWDCENEMLGDPET